MKYLFLFFCVFCFLFTGSMANSNDAPKFVEITKSYTSVYEKLDPKSSVLEYANKKDLFPLIFEGTTWYQVKVNDKIGWIEKSSGDIVAHAGMTIFSMPIGTFFFLILLIIATISGASYLIYKQKVAEI